MKKNKIIYIVIIVILVLYLFLFLFTNSKRNEKNSKKNDYLSLMVSSDASFLYQNGSWSVIGDHQKSNYNWKKYKVYENSDYLGQYYLLYSGVWNLLDLKKNKIDLSLSDKIAVGGDLDFEVLPFQQKESLEKDSYVVSVLKQNGFSTDTALTVNDTISIDIDDDGILEKIYVVSNAFIDTEQPIKIFNFIFMVNDDKVSLLSSKIFSSTSLSTTCKPYISHIMKINGRYYFVVNCSRYSDLGKTVSLYSYKNNKFIKVVSN